MIESFGFFFNGIFRRGATENPEKVCEVLSYLSLNQIDQYGIWHSGLVGIADSEDPSWVTLAPLVAEQEKRLFEQESWAIAWWAKKAIEALPADSDGLDFFWPIFNDLLEYV